MSKAGIDSMGRPIFAPKAADPELERSAKILEASIKAASPTGTQFGLNGPGQFVIKTRAGEYRRKDFIGSEKFLFQGAYAGKKGRVIMVFRPIKPGDFAFMEMSMDEAETSMTGFAAVIEKALENQVEPLMLDTDAKEKAEQARQAALAKEEEARLAAVHEASPIWGSW